MKFIRKWKLQYHDRLIILEVRPTLFCDSQQFHQIVKNVLREYC